MSTFVPTSRLGGHGFVILRVQSAPCLSAHGCRLDCAVILHCNLGPAGMQPSVNIPLQDKQSSLLPGWSCLVSGVSENAAPYRHLSTGSENFTWWIGCCSLCSSFGSGLHAVLFFLKYSIVGFLGILQKIVLRR